MKKDITPFDRWLKTQNKKRKNYYDQIILDQILQNLKKKHELERKQKIEELSRKLEELRL